MVQDTQVENEARLLSFLTGFSQETPTLLALGSLFVLKVAE